MTTKIVDISDELYREMGEPSDLSVASIAYWLRTNIGKLNVLLNKAYSIDESTLEISGDESFTMTEKSIFKLLYSIQYYERLFRNALGSASVDSVLSVTDDGSTVVKVNKNELAKSYGQLKKQAYEELQSLLNKYELNEVTPLQVAGDDTIPSPHYSQTYDTPRTIGQ
jgi:homoserine dehydrogenase